MDIVKWEFLNEPAYRWFMFLGLLIVMLAGWKLILNQMD